MPPRKAETKSQRTLLVEDSHGFFRVTIPEEWKVTFGNFNPGRDKYGQAVDDRTALRIYESEQKQRAVFVGVRSFRDLSLPVERLVIEESGQNTWTRDEGGFTETKAVKRSKKWTPEE